MWGFQMIRPLIVILMLSLGACASVHKEEAKDTQRKPVQWAPAKKTKVAANQLPVYYATPGVKFKKVCKIEASGANFIATQFTKKSDFESQFRRRAKQCKGANAIVIENMFAFEHGSAFADGMAIEIDPES